nr:hypothetical protein HK105_008275 [Polyrhizophydium stewartii]
MSTAPEDCGILAAAFPALGLTSTCCDGKVVSCSNGRVVGISPVGRLSITIPDILQSLTALTTLDLNNNAITGTIPAWLGRMPQLQVINLINNTLTGSIPDSLGSLSALTYLGLDSNSLTGTIPPSLGQLSQLKQLWLSNNRLTGTIPDTFSKLTGLNYLILENNLLTGPIPSWLLMIRMHADAHVDALRAISYNSLSGQIPDALGKLSKLEWLNARDNYLTGSIPQSIAKLGSLTVLRLENNPQLSGPLPDGWTKLTDCKLGNTGLCSSGSAPVTCALQPCNKSGGGSGSGSGDAGSSGSSVNAGLIGGVVAAVVVVILAAIGAVVYLRVFKTKAKYGLVAGSAGAAGTAAVVKPDDHAATTASSLGTPAPEYSARPTPSPTTQSVIVQVAATGTPSTGPRTNPLSVASGPPPSREPSPAGSSNAPSQAPVRAVLVERTDGKQTQVPQHPHNVASMLNSNTILVERDPTAAPAASLAGGAPLSPMPGPISPVSSGEAPPLPLATSRIAGRASMVPNSTVRSTPSSAPSLPRSESTLLNSDHTPTSG